MPQLDKFAFFPVVSWVIVIMIVLYNIIIGSGLATLYKILLYRKKKLEYYVGLREHLAGEQYYLLLTHVKFLVEYITMIRLNTEKSLHSIEGVFEVTKDVTKEESNLEMGWFNFNWLAFQNKMENEFGREYTGEEEYAYTKMLFEECEESEEYELESQDLSEHK